jgi:hypothetical protein
LKARNVLLVVVPVALLAAAALAWIRFGNLEGLLTDLSRPKIVPGKGQVTFGGKPLPNAQVMTQPVGGKGLSAIGGTDQEGKFTLMTDIRGTFVEGVTLGDHLVTVAARENISVPGGPPLITPAKYADAQSTPFRITVVNDPAKNEFNFVLEGEPPPPRAMPAGGLSPPRPPGAGGGGKGGRSGRGKRGGRGGEPAETTAAPAEIGSPDNGKAGETKAGETKTDETKSESTTPDSTPPEKPATSPEAPSGEPASAPASSSEPKPGN